jgi:hypothetical protein
MRFKVVNENTVVGYNYILNKFYVLHKNTVTYRDTAEVIKQVLDIVAANEVTVEQISRLKSTVDTIYALSYTLHDTGAYVSTIQFNEYFEHPLVLDCERRILRVMNSELIFNLDLNESRASRIDTLIEYYREYVGLEITQEQFLLIYNFLISMYIPYVYNVITDTSTTPVLYSNIFAVSDWNNSSVAVYNCTSNPDDISVDSDEPVAYLIEAESSTNTLLCRNLEANVLKAGDSIDITGATTTTDTYSYSVNGVYTVQAVDTTVTPATIVVAEPLPASYTFPYIEVYKRTNICNILRMNRDESSIVLDTEVPNTLVVGDTIEVIGTENNNKVYTIQEITSIEEDDTVLGVITVQENIPTNYEKGTGEHPELSKNVYIGDLYSAHAGTSTDALTLVENAVVTVELNDKLYLNNREDNIKYYYTVTSQPTVQSTFTCTVEYGDRIPEYSAQDLYPSIHLRTPSTDILIEVTSSKKPLLLPTGSFLVDNFTECCNYLGLLDGLPIPTTEIYNKIGTEVGEDKVIDESLPDCKYIGLYSKVYTEEERGV